MNQHGAMQMHGARPPFTPSQWQELEHQALIFKYILAGIPVPPDLLIPIKKSLEALGPSFFHQHHHHHHHHPNMPWSSFHLGFAKNCDPEPGRCRRTDGKKWRCSKDAFPDSKYCERHMHRGRNRSRKPVENLVSHSSSSLSLSTTASHRNNSNMSSNSTLSFTHTPYSSSSSSRLSNNAFHQHPSSANTSNLSDFAIDNSGSSYALPSKDYSGYNRYMKGDIDEHVFFRSEDNRVGMGESGGGGAWRSIPSKSNQQSAKHEHHQYSFLNSSFGGGEMEVQMEMENSSSSSSVVSAVGVKMEEQPLRHFFDDWPRSTRDTPAMTWNDIDDDRSNRRSSTTQLSISIPITSDFSPPRACK